MRQLEFVVAVVASLTLGCGAAAHSSLGNPAESTCPGSPPLNCLTTPECSFDLNRQCNLCRCSPATPPPAQGPVNAEGIPPIH